MRLLFSSSKSLKTLWSSISGLFLALWDLCAVSINLSQIVLGEICTSAVIKSRNTLALGLRRLFDKPLKERFINQSVVGVVCFSLLRQNKQEINFSGFFYSFTYFYTELLIYLYRWAPRLLGYRTWTRPLWFSFQRLQTSWLQHTLTAATSFEFFLLFHFIELNIWVL